MQETAFHSALFYLKEIWYDDRRAGIIPAHAGFCVYRRKPGAKFRRRHHGRGADMV